MKLVESALEPQFASIFDIEHVRADFPILKLQVDGKPLVYLDNAASAQAFSWEVKAVRADVSLIEVER